MLGSSFTLETSTKVRDGEGTGGGSEKVRFPGA